MYPPPTSIQPRRSSRQRQSRQNDSTGPLSRWRHLSQTWRQQFIDLGHCRISKCTRRLIDASDDERAELRSLDISFVALSISAAASTSGKVRAGKEQDILNYINAANQYNLPANDDHNGDSAVELAAYHGLTDILTLLLHFGCPLQKNTSQRNVAEKKNAVFAAIRNGQHAALEIILSMRKSEAQRVVRGESHLPETGLGNVYYFSCLMETITKCDVTSTQLLLSAGCASMSDIDAKMIFSNKKLKRHKRLEKLLRLLYPTIPNVMHWRGEYHWSFPKTDRETLNWLWHVLHHPSNPEIIPDEILMRVFSFIGRGWFASQRYELIGRPRSADLLERNIIQSTTA